jgi:hypothetical protein
MRVTVGRRTREHGEVEVQIRRGLTARSEPLEEAPQALVELLPELP